MLHIIGRVTSARGDKKKRGKPNETWRHKFPIEKQFA
jgi:hypothetical protein